MPSDPAVTRTRLPSQAGNQVRATIAPTGSGNTKCGAERPAIRPYRAGGRRAGQDLLGGPGAERDRQDLGRPKANPLGQPGNNGAAAQDAGGVGWEVMTPEASR
jgi:hypothetical protein